MYFVRFCIPNFSLLGLSKSGIVFFVVGLSVSEADSLVESQLCGTVSPKGLFGVVSSFSTAF